MQFGVCLKLKVPALDALALDALDFDLPSFQV